MESSTMTEFRTGLPTTTRRHEVLRDCLVWIGVCYEGGEAPKAWHRAVRETLQLPVDDGLLRPRMFTPMTYEHVLLAFEEILALGLHYENHAEQANAETVVANASWHAFMDGVYEIDLSDDQGRYAHVDAMVAGLEHWLTHTPGGLADATRDLDAIVHLESAVEL
jgi:hypothetical protein